MHIPEGMDKFSRNELANLGDHHGQQGIGSNIERHSQEYVCTPLVELATQFSLGYIKLEHRMTRHECHFWKIGYIPGTDNQSPAVRRRSDLSDHLGNLV